MKPIPLFGLGLTGKSVSVTAQKRLNMYAEVLTDGEKNGLAFYPTPGKILFSNLGAAPVRGMWPAKGYLWVVQGGTLFRLDNAGNQTIIGYLATGAGRVSMIDNGIQLIIVDGPNGYIYNFNTMVFGQITDPDFPGGNTVTFMNGVFIVNKPNTGQFYISAVYDGTSWDSLQFATAENDPDDLVSVFVDTGNLILFGDKTTEFWGDSNSADFMFARIGSAAIEYGLAARWSLCKFDNTIIFLRKNRLGQSQICVMNGFQSAPVSTPELDYTISQYSVVSDATGFSYMLGGHPMYQINFPTAGESWLFDGQSKSWSKVGTDTGRDNAEISVNFLDKTYVSDNVSGNIYVLSATTYTNNGATIPREIICRHQDAGDFTRISQLWIEFEPGIGLQNGQGYDPKVMMQISRDGGKTYGAELWASIGKIGMYKQRALWNRLGRARDWVFKFRITDPIKPVIVTAWGVFGK